jgi:hypothetical protein
MEVQFKLLELEILLQHLHHKAIAAAQIMADQRLQIMEKVEGVELELLVVPQQEVLEVVEVLD